MDKLEKIIEVAKNNEFKLNELLGKKKEEETKTNVLLWIFAIIGVAVAAAGIAYAVYRYLNPDYLEDFDDDFDDDFEEDDDDEEEDIFEDEGAN